MALTALTSIGVGVAGGFAAYGGVTAAGALIGGLSATGIGIIIAAPIAIILGSASIMWSRKGKAEEYVKMIMGRREGIKDKAKTLLEEHFNDIASLFEKYVDAKFA